MEPKSGWTIDGDDEVALLRSIKLNARVKVNQPCHGLHALDFLGKPLVDFQLLKVQPVGSAVRDTEVVVECYRRGADLIVTYAQTPDRTVRPQVYWRYQEFNGAYCVDALVSMQTSLLESDPMANVSSQFGQGQLLVWNGEQFNALESSAKAVTVDSHLCLFRSETADVSVAKMIFPSDLERGTACAAATGCEVGFELFNHDLEKGVIRRGQVRVAFLRPGDDEQMAVELFEQLKHSAPPLTT